MSAPWKIAFFLLIVFSSTLGFTAPTKRPNYNDNGRWITVVVGNSADPVLALAYKCWVQKKIWDTTNPEFVRKIWKNSMLLRSIAHPLQTGEGRCINIDRPRADGRYRKYKPDADLKRIAYQAATNIMGADARFVDIGISTNTDWWATYYIWITN